MHISEAGPWIGPVQEMDKMLESYIFWEELTHPSLRVTALSLLCTAVEPPSGQDQSQQAGKAQGDTLKAAPGPPGFGSILTLAE